MEGLDGKPQTESIVINLLKGSSYSNKNEMDSVFKVSGSADAIQNFKASIERFKRSIV